MIEIKKKQMPLLGRTEYIFDSDNIKKQQAIKQIAKLLNINQDQIVIKYIKPYFGINKCQIFANIYKNKELLEKFEKINKKKKHGKKEKKEQSTK